MDSWIGYTKHDLILKWGPPYKTSPDGAGGEIVMYYSYYFVNAVTTYKYKMFYIGTDGKIYHWLTQSGQEPPETMTLYVH